MDNCCEDKVEELKRLRLSQGRVLKIVLAINTIMFFMEMTAGILARSTALQADALDMLGDAAVYAFSLYVLHRSDRWRAGAGIMKAGIMALFGAGVLIGAIFRALSGTVPVGQTMGIIGGIALLANIVCFVLLFRHRSDDVNMSSTWLCSRNDIIANLSVLAAAGLVVWTRSFWPDVAVGFGIAALFLWDAAGVFKDSASLLKRGGN